MPRLDTDEAKLSFLLEVKKQIPDLFAEAVQYEIDLFELLDNERQLVSLLRKEFPNSYEQLFKDKKYFDLSIRPSGNGIPVGTVHIKPEAVESWKEGLKRSVNELKMSGSLSPDQFPVEVQKLQAKMTDVDPKEILARIGRGDERIQGSSAQESSRRINAKNWADFNACRQLPRLKSRFECIRTQRARFEGLSSLPSEAELDRLIQSVDSEEKLQELIELQAVMRLGVPSERIKTWDELDSRISRLNVEDLVHLDDKDDALKPLVIDTLAPVVTSISPQVKDRALDTIHKKIHSFASQTMTHQAFAKEPVKISQVLPQIGIFRGCTGNDCSTKFSFPYPNDPHEMVFLVEGEDSAQKSKKLKGYVSATVVDLPEGKKGLYVITISGSRVNAKDTEVILRGLEKEKEKLGVDHIVLPPSSRLSSLINFGEIREVYNSHVQGEREVPIHYQDSEIRSQIEQFRPQKKGSGFKISYNDARYDFARNNSSGVILKFKDKKSDSVTVDLARHEDLNLSHRDLAEYSKSELIEFIIDLNHVGREDELKRILGIQTLGMDTGVFNQLFRLFRKGGESSDQKMTVRNLKREIQNHLEKLGVSHLLEKKPYLIYPGVLHCSDAYSGENLEEVAKLIVRDLTEEKSTSPYFDARRLDTETKRKLYGLPVFNSLIEDFLRKLSDEDFDVRQSAMDALVDMNSQDPRVHQALAQILLSKDSGARNAAASALIKLQTQDQETLQVILSLLKSSDAKIRDFSVRLLRDIKPKNPKVYRDLALALKDRESFVRVSVAEAFGEIKPQDLEIQRALVEALKDPVPEVRLSAAESLGEVNPQDPEIHQKLVEALEGPYDEIHPAIAYVLWMAEPKNHSVHQALARALITDRDSGARQYAAEALGETQFRDPEIFKALTQALKDKSELVRLAGVQALGRIKSDDLEVHLALIHALRDSNEDVRISALQVLDEMDRSQSLKQLRPELDRCLKDLSKQPISDVHLRELIDLMTHLHQKSEVDQR